MAFLVFAGGIVVAVASPDVASADLNAATVSAGNEHTCAITTGGALKCWGWNRDGQLGDGLGGGGGNGGGQLTPDDVVGLGSGVAAVSAGNSDTCALTTGGAVKCWGSQVLDDGSIVNNSIPVDVTGLGSGVAAISTDGGPSCALTTGGAVLCWGGNGFGDLGDGTTNDSADPVPVSGLGAGVVAISAGSGYACALTSSGAVKCWGYNGDGELGDGTTTNRRTPVDVSGLGSGVAQIAAGGNHTCAVTDAGAVKCWGRNDFGQLGHDDTTRHLVPVDVSSLDSGVVSVSSGGYHTCALTTVGAVECWGRNSLGQLGDASTGDSPVPVAVAGLGSGVVSVTAGGFHSCALTTDGAVHCWGYNSSGELGNGSAIQQLTPVDVAGLDSGVASIANGYHHTCAVTDSGAAKCWGDNSAGQLGDGTTIERDTPVDVTGLPSGVDAIAGGYDHTCALTDAGAVKCWGDNAYGQLGDGTTTERHSPVPVSGLGSGVVAISAGVYHTCALTTGGAVKCWGYNSDGELGDSSTTERRVPVNVSGLGSGVGAIAAGGTHTCALTTGGGVKCWGLSEALGNGGVATPPGVPVDVSGLGSGVAAITGGGSHACAVTDAGALKCWGDDTEGQLGDNSISPADTPVDVTGFGSGAVAVAGGASQTCALTSSGGVKCWGDNEQGELGDGSTNTHSTPSDVSGLTSGVASITAEGDHSCALTTGGGVKCWGYNANGQLGSGTAGSSLVPVAVVGLGLGGAEIPDAPAHVSAAAGDGSATASWMPPADNGGAVVYGYEVIVTNANGDVPTGVTGRRVRLAHGTTFRFTGLSNGVKYRLDVAPINRAGIGASALSSIVRPRAPQPPPAPKPRKPNGYWMVGATGHVFAFGHLSNYGSASASAVTHIETTPTGHGYWVVDAAGSVFAFGDAKRLAGAGTLATGEVVRSLSSTVTGHGYWLFTNRGRVISRGDAKFFGDLNGMHLNGSIVGSVATPSGKGYYMVGSDGGVFTFGDAKFRGSMGAAHLNAPVNALVPTKDNRGYWLVASDGGIFAFNAPFRGSMGAVRLNRPVVGMVRYGDGYLMAASDGGVFDFSDKPFAGSLGATPPRQPIVSIAASG